MDALGDEVGVDGVGCDDNVDDLSRITVALVAGQDLDTAARIVLEVSSPVTRNDDRERKDPDQGRSSSAT